MVISLSLTLSLSLSLSLSLFPFIPTSHVFVNSSVLSSLNALSAVTWEDILKPSFGEKVSETGKTWVTRIFNKFKNRGSYMTARV